MYIKPFHIWIRWISWVALTPRSEKGYMNKEKNSNRRNYLLLNKKHWMDMWSKNSLCVFFFRKKLLSNVGRIVMPITNDLWYQELGY